MIWEDAHYMDDMKYFAIKGHADTDFEAIHLCAQKLKEEGYVTDQFESNCINREKECFSNN